MKNRLEYSTDIKWIKDIISSIILSYGYYISENPTPITKSDTSKPSNPSNPSNPTKAKIE